MGKGHCLVLLTWDSGPWVLHPSCSTQQGIAAWVPSSTWYGKGVGFQSLHHTRLPTFLIPWALEDAGKGSIRLENCPVICYKHIVNCWSLWCPSLLWWVNAIPFGSLEAMSTLIHTGEKKNISRLKMEACKGMSTLSESWRVRGETRTLACRVYPLFLPLQLSPFYIYPKALHLWVPSLTCLQYLVSALGVPRGDSDNIHHHQVHKAKLLQTQSWTR